MRYREFRQWAWEHLGYRLPVAADGTYWERLWGRPRTGRAGAGNGHYAEYTAVQQQRLAFWLRARDLIDNKVLAEWTDMGSRYSDGWIVNDGGGIRWELQPDWLALADRGVVAVRCGV